MGNQERRPVAGPLRWLARETRGLLGGVVGGVVGGIGAFTMINHFSGITLIGTADPVSIANTYIVYTTFVIAAVALFLTIAGFMFTQQFAMDKEDHVAHAYSSLVHELSSKDDKAVAVLMAVMTRPGVVQHMEDSVKSKLAEIAAANAANAQQRAERARNEQEFFKDLANDLENGGTGKGGGK